jgi:hypothetical protein
MLKKSNFVQKKKFFLTQENLSKSRMVTVFQSRFLHRTIVIQIFMTRKDIKLISYAIKILEMSILSKKNSF